MRIRQGRGGAAWALLGAGAVLGAFTSAGCGSSSSDTGSTARIRAVSVAANAAANAVTSNVLVNNGVVGGDLTPPQTTGYNYVSGGVSNFSFTTNATVPSGITNPPIATLMLNTGSYYTAYLIGRPDVQGNLDPRFLQTVATGDRGAAAAYVSASYADPPAGQANVRILNGAPDAGAGAVDVLVNGKIAFTKVAYPALPTASASGTTLSASGATVPIGPTTTPVTPYQAFPAGTLSIQVNAAGTATVLVPPTAVPVGSNSYTIVVTEPTIAPTYGLYTVNDQPQQ